MQFALEGKAYWAFTYKSCQLAPDTETVAKLEKLDQCAIAIPNAHNSVY